MRTDMKYIDSLSGRQFEKWVYKLFFKDYKAFHKLGLTYSKPEENVKLTSVSNDFGIDVIFENYGIQCKHVTGSIIGYKAVEEAFTGTKYYGLSQPVVITNGMFSNHAKKGADKLNISLINRDGLKDIINICNRDVRTADIASRCQPVYLNNYNLYRLRTIYNKCDYPNINYTLSKIINIAVNKLFSKDEQNKLSEKYYQAISKISKYSKK